MKLTIATQNENTYDIFERMFKDEKDVVIYLGSAFDVESEALVSPANSFGYMDGGFDAQILDTLGSYIENRVREKIARVAYGELPIGRCSSIGLDRGAFKNLLIVPTMRVPMDVHLTSNAYVAMRAMLSKVKTDEIDSVTMPVLCTGVGKMDPLVAATQMKMAYKNIIGEMRYDSFELAHMSQIKMLSPDFTF
jgi:O-acetyl-ADP-ribose deacetylase (regulator of RNase III)